MTSKFSYPLIPGSFKLRKNWFVLFVLCLFTDATSFSQTNADHQTDSIREVLTHHEIHDSTRILAHLTMVDLTFRDNTDSAWVHASCAYNIAKKLNDKNSMAHSVSWLAYISQLHSDQDQALKYYKEMYQLTKALNDMMGMGICLGNMAHIYSSQGNTEKALEMLQKGLENSKSANDEIGEINILRSIGTIYANLGNIKKALSLFYESLRLSEKLTNHRGIGAASSCIASILVDQKQFEEALPLYQKDLETTKLTNDLFDRAHALSSMAYLYMCQKEPKKAIPYYLEELDISRNQGFRHGEACATHNLSTAYIQLDSIPKGMQLLHYSLDIFKELNDPGWLSNTYEKLGNQHYVNGKLDSADYYSDLALSIAEELGYPMQIERSAELRYNILSAKKDFKGAFIMFNRHIQMRDSLKNKNLLKVMISKQAEYEYEKGELRKEYKKTQILRASILMLANRNNRHYSFIVIALLGFFIIVLISGLVKTGEATRNGILFFFLFILFEFVLVLIDPEIEKLSSGAPVYKLFTNVILAALFIPAHFVFNRLMKWRVKSGVPMK